ncbi:hypothetical protein FGO68_gene8365 [Halteria grandinella]|uniref:Uncharacterized protein n=1 Tax=Halteria grandinella TaxID=5974 RepID=A0A8J8N9N8_HALGN|nr:hypothetical protein FGO68_gene8365 [Halteria grandinella]
MGPQRLRDFLKWAPDVSSHGAIKRPQVVAVRVQESPFRSHKMLYLLWNTRIPCQSCTQFWKRALRWNMEYSHTPLQPGWLAKLFSNPVLLRAPRIVIEHNLDVLVTKNHTCSEASNPKSSIDQNKIGGLTRRPNVIPYVERVSGPPVHFSRIDGIPKRPCCPDVRRFHNQTAIRVVLQRGFHDLRRELHVTLNREDLTNSHSGGQSSASTSSIFEEACGARQSTLQILNLINRHAGLIRNLQSGHQNLSQPLWQTRALYYRIATKEPLLCQELLGALIGHSFQVRLAHYPVTSGPATRRDCDFWIRHLALRPDLSSPAGVDCYIANRGRRLGKKTPLPPALPALGLALSLGTQL